MWLPQSTLERQGSMQTLRLGSASSTDSLDDLLSEVRSGSGAYFSLEMDLQVPLCQGCHAYGPVTSFLTL